MNIEQDVALGRLTTVGIGGPARHFARPESVAELEEALRWAAAEELDVFTIGLGSNVLVADEGVDALVLRLAGELAAAATRCCAVASAFAATSCATSARNHAARASTTAQSSFAVFIFVVNRARMDWIPASRMPFGR